MSVTMVAFAAVALFVVHEFEEIIRCRPWIERHGADPAYAKDTWVRNRRFYPSTETIAACIGEEIVLFALLLFGAGLALYSPLVFAVTFANAAHLLGHLAAAWQSRSWNPGSVTAAITLPFNIALLVLAARGQDVPALVVCALAVALLATGNLALLHRAASRIDALVHHRGDIG